MTTQVGAPPHPKTTAAPLLPDSDGHAHQHCDTRPWFSQAIQRTSYPRRGHTPMPTERDQQIRNGHTRHKNNKGPETQLIHDALQEQYRSFLFDELIGELHADQVAFTAGAFSQ